MSSFPTPHTVGVHTWAIVGEDSHGNEISGYTPPLDEPGTPHAVIGWQVPASTEPVVAGHDRLTVDVELGLPVGFVLGRRDVVDLPYGPAGQFEVVGEIRESAANPFGWGDWPGVANLQRVEG